MLSAGNRALLVRDIQRNISDLDYADDLATVTEHISDTKSILHTLETPISIVGLHYKDKKTEYNS